MNSKQIVGILALAVGIALTSFGLYAKHKINIAKGDVEGVSSFLPKNRVGSTIGDTLRGKASQYDTLVNLSLLGGIILLIGGAGSIVFFRKK